MLQKLVRIQKYNDLYLVRDKDFKYFNFIDKKGELIYPEDKFIEIEPCFNDQYAILVRKHNNKKYYGLADSKGKIIIPANLSGIIVVEKDDNTIYYDLENITNKKDGFIFLKNKNNRYYWGFVDLEKKVHLKPKFNFQHEKFDIDISDLKIIRDNENIYFPVKLKSKYGLISNSEEWIIPPIFKYFYFTDEKIYFGLKNKEFIIDLKPFRKIKTKPKFKEIIREIIKSHFNQAK